MLHQLEKYRIETDTRIRLRQLELQVKSEETGLEKRLYVDPNINVNSVAVSTDSGYNPVSASMSVLSDSLSSVPFNVAKNIALVPPFQEKENKAYFQPFERIAMALKWPIEFWSLMLKCKLTGKAQEVCTSLSLEESVQFDAVKNAILRAYELVPEHYRQRFRMTKKSASQTYVEFTPEKSVLFNRWIKACNATDYNYLRKLLLIEEFKNCVSECTALYSNEQKVTTVQQAVILADEYALMHKLHLLDTSRKQDIVLKKKIKFVSLIPK